MALTYSDILTDVLQQKHSKCTCPPGTFSPISYKKPKSTKACCQFGPNCQFMHGCGDNASVSTPPQVCDYNQAKCTCYTQCLCGPPPQAPVQLLQGLELDRAIDRQMCICGANCFCESEIDFIARPTVNCDKTRCNCAVCLCRPDASDTSLLPTSFRNKIKREQLSIDERLKLECAEIKQMLAEHEESKRKELEEASDDMKEKVHKGKKREREESTDNSNEKVFRKQKELKVSIADENVLMSTHTEYGETIEYKEKTENKEENESITLHEGSESQSHELSIPTEQTLTISKEKPVSTKRMKKGEPPKRKPRKIKSVTSQTKSMIPSQYTQYSCGCRMPKKKSLHMRYYFSGGTEHYGVKLGHKQCYPKPALVPRNMGWLWNIEDRSKGIRERKGWPPGFIAKNIKNMMKVMKQMESVAAIPGTTTTPHSESGGKRFPFRRRVEGDTNKEPQEDPPLLHIHKKGRTYNITFCPKSSDTDIGPIPIPFSITEKKRDSDSGSSDDSTLEFEFHSPKPKRPPTPDYLREKVEEKPPEEVSAEPSDTTVKPPSNKTQKKKLNKKRSVKSTEENKNMWEEQPTQMENIA